MHYLDVSPIYVRFLKASEILGTSTTMQPWLEHEIAWQETKDFPRQALWSPDGLFFLVKAESHALHLYQVTQEGCTCIHSSKAPSPILDVRWYPIPLYRENDEGVSEAHWCYFLSCRDVPVRLIDAWDGSVKASYGILNHVESYLSPYSLSLNREHTILYGGLSEALSISFLSQVGTNLHMALDVSLNGSEDGVGGHHGIVSALAVGSAPNMLNDQPTQSLEVSALGTFSNEVGLYITEPEWLCNMKERGLSYPWAKFGTDASIPGETVCLASWRIPEGQGIVQLAWHPIQKNILVAASRKSKNLYVFDTNYLYGMRDPFHCTTLSSTDSSLIAMLPRDSGTTYQRLLFDIDPQGKFIAAGDEQGKISVWTWDSIVTGSPDRIISPTFEWFAHEDPIGSVQFSPIHTQRLLSVSGTRLYDNQATPINDDQKKSNDPNRSLTTPYVKIFVLE